MLSLQFIPLLDNTLALAGQNIIPASQNNDNNNFGSAGLDQRDSNQLSQRNGTQVFNMIICQGDAFFMELSSNPNLVITGGTSGTPLTLGYRDTIGLYANQLFKLNGPYIM